MSTDTKWNAWRSRRWLKNCTSVGADPCLTDEPTIYADVGELRIGNRFRLSSRPVASHLVTGPGATLQIGNDVSIGCGAAIAAFQHVSIGNATQIGPFVIIMDTNFHGAPGNQSIEHDTRPVIIGNDCRIGARVTITRGATIGDGAEILAGSVVSSSIPAGACAAGARARVIGQAGAATSRWDSASALLPEILMTSLNLTSPPDIDDSLVSSNSWTDAGVRTLLVEIEKQFGVILDFAAAWKFASYASIANAIQEKLDQQQ